MAGPRSASTATHSPTSTRTTRSCSSSATSSTWRRSSTPCRPGGLAVTHVGGAAMTLPRYVQHTRPGSPQVVLEPDAALTERVRRDLPLPRGHRIRVRPQPGRVRRDRPQGRQRRRRGRRCLCRQPGAGRPDLAGVVRGGGPGAAARRTGPDERRRRAGPPSCGPRPCRPRRTPATHPGRRRGRHLEAAPVREPGAGRLSPATARWRPSPGRSRRHPFPAASSAARSSPEPWAPPSPSPTTTPGPRRRHRCPPASGECAEPHHPRALCDIRSPLAATRRREAA